MKDVGMPTCKLSSCSSCLFAFLYRHPYFIYHLFNWFLYLFVLFLYDCKSTSIAIYSQDEVVTCIGGGMYIINFVHFSDYAVEVFEYQKMIYIFLYYACVLLLIISQLILNIVIHYIQTHSGWCWATNSHLLSIGCLRQILFLLC